MKHPGLFFVWTAVGLHFGLIALFNMAHISSGTCQDLLVHILTKVQRSTICGVYSNWTGLLGGYGFYSPSVGNTYHIQFGCYQRYTTRYYNNPGLTSASAQMRFQAYLDIGGSLLDQQNSQSAALRDRAKASVQVACRHMAKQQPCDSLVAQLVTKRIIPLNSRNSKNPIHLSLYRHVEIVQQQP